jgi:hypothetical protein
MSGQPTSQAAVHKPCVCRVFPQARWIWRPTHRVNAQQEEEFTCRLCGATTWKHAEAVHSVGTRDTV